MQWTADSNSTILSITLRGERRRSDIAHFLVPAICVIGIRYFIGDEIARVIGTSIGLLWSLAVLLRQQFGTSILTITPGTVALDRRTLGIGRTRTFPRTDTERLGFEPGTQYDDGALALMVRTVMMPIRFSHGISATEAEAVFAKIKQDGSWIGSLIRPVGTPMF